ncbi:MAG: DNA adenine methylase [Flexilinea sp.]|nr:DNA adenine methylase [Flexilinea sp.]
MAMYGIPYQGSKSAIADDIIAHLPAGNRLVDLFGGGFAISHCALLSRKWKQVLYNDINPLLIPLIRGAIAGKYSYEQFVPEFISREEFFAKKDTDGYVKWIWSFGNDGRTYMFSKNVEPMKRAGHEWVFHNTPISGFHNLKCDLPCDAAHFSERRKFLSYYTKAHKSERYELQQLQQLQRLERLQRLEQLERLERLQQLERITTLEMTCMDYRDYKYQDGDVVYCDIPYQNTSDRNPDYGINFDFGAFYGWAVAQPYPVYFSSYKLGGLVWSGEKISTMAAASNSLKRVEALYCVDDHYNPPPKYIQLPMF